MPAGPARHWAAAAAAFLMITLATGSTGSAALPLLVAAIIGLIRHWPTPVVLVAPPVAATLLLLADLVRDAPEGPGLARAAAVLLAAVPGLLWRRDARRAADRIARFETASVAPATGPTSPTPGDEQKDLERALGAVGDRLGARGVVLWEVDGYRGTARPRAGWPGRPHAPLRLSGDPLGWVWQEGMRLRLPRTPRWAEAGLTVVAERLRRQEDRGDLVTYVFEPGLLPAAETVFDEGAVYLRGVMALHEARAGAAAAQRRLATLVQGLRRMPGELELETLAADLCETARSLTDATGAVLGTWDEGEGAGEVLATAGGDGGPRPGDRFSLPASELALAVRADTMIARTADDWRHGATCVAHPDERWHARPRAMAALPLHGAAGTNGVLAVWTAGGPDLDPAALDLLHALSPYAALHLEHARAFGRLRERADQDALTQLRNRRAFHEILAAEGARFERYGRTVALLMVDLDHFKSINDGHGHEAGDEVLRRVGRTLMACVRDVDNVARLGGEEFVVLLPETDLAAAVDVANRVRAAIAAAPVEWRGGLIQVRASIGVAACPDIVTSPGDLVGAADAALYAAKEAGRDRVMAAERPPRRYRPPS
jgi:diguanylate cyclase (GGDEF)-like protein